MILETTVKDYLSGIRECLQNLRASLWQKTTAESEAAVKEKTLISDSKQAFENGKNVIEHRRQETAAAMEKAVRDAALKCRKLEDQLHENQAEIEEKKNNAADTRDIDEQVVRNKIKNYQQKLNDDIAAVKKCRDSASETLDKTRSLPKQIEDILTPTKDLDKGRIFEVAKNSPSPAKPSVSPSLDSVTVAALAEQLDLKYNRGLKDTEQVREILQHYENWKQAKAENYILFKSLLCLGLAVVSGLFWLVATSPNFSDWSFYVLLSLAVFLPPMMFRLAQRIWNYSTKKAGPTTGLPLPWWFYVPLVASVKAIIQIIKQYPESLDTITLRYPVAKRASATAATTGIGGIIIGINAFISEAEICLKDLESRVDPDIASLRRQYDVDFQQCQVELDQVRQRYENTIQKIDDEMVQIKQQNEKDIKRVGMEREQFREQNNQQLYEIKVELEQINTRHDAYLETIKKNHSDQVEKIKKEFEETREWIQREISELKNANALIGAPWDDPDWQNWPQNMESNRATLFRIGSLIEQNAGDPIEIPALCPLFGKGNIIIKTSGEGKEKASLIVQNLMLRLVTLVPPGKLKFTLVDPVGFGKSLSAFMYLDDFDGKITTGGKIWTRSQHIEDRLMDLTEHIERVTQNFLRSRYRTIEEYNVQALERAEPYRILVIMDFPSGFSEDTINRLISISRDGPRCGVYIIMTWDTEKKLPSGF
jgi:hypothetical protein